MLTPKQQSRLDARTTKKFNELREGLRNRLSAYFQLEETVFGGIGICTAEQFLLKVYVQDKTITVHRVYTSDNMLVTDDLEKAISTIVKHLESRVDEARPMATAPIGEDKPFIVIVKRIDGILFRVAYFHNDNYKVIGSQFADDFAEDKLVGWLPIEGIKYDI